MKTVALIKSVFSAVADVAYPPHCLLSGLPIHNATGLYSQISRASLDACAPAPSQTDLMLAALRHVDADELYISSFHSLWAAGATQADAEHFPGIDKAIYAIKYKGRTRLAFDLGCMLGESLKESEVQVDAIVPVPIHHARKRERGYNQAEFIAQGVASVLHVPVTNSIRRTRYTGTQTSLSELKRQDNVQFAFVVENHVDVKGARILLIDDVLTTGATLNACAFALLEANARRVDAATLAAA